MGRLRHQSDGLEPRADNRGPCGGSIAHHRALFATRLRSGLIVLKEEFLPTSPRIDRRQLLEQDSDRAQTTRNC